MKPLKYVTLLIFFVFLNACDSEMSLQKYLVTSAEKKEFISMNMPAFNLWEMANLSLTENEKEAINSVKKVNLLVFQKTIDNETQFNTEVTKVTDILENSNYKDLVNINATETKIKVLFLGTEETVEEVVFFGRDTNLGFGILRVLGENIHIESLVKTVFELEKKYRKELDTKETWMPSSLWFNPLSLLHHIFPIY